MIASDPWVLPDLVGLVTLLRVALKHFQHEVFARAGYVFPLQRWELNLLLLDLLEQHHLVL